MNRAAVAYVVRNGMLLSVTRKDTGQHAAPGGRVDAVGCEPWGEAACRELYEETGMAATSSRLVYRGWNGDWFVAVYLVEAEGEPIAREPGTRVAWVCPEEIANGFGAELHRKALEAAGLLDEHVERAIKMLGSQRYGDTE